MPRELAEYQLIERSLIKKYRKQIWNPFIAAVKRYRLISKNDTIAVCISGGKDSMLLAVLMKHLKSISPVPFDVKYLVMDPGYNAVNRRKIEDNAALMNIPITVFETDIFDIADSVDKSPCYLCARMRRGYLYSQAQKLGCNKIALGHHLNDVIETTFMSMMYSSQLQGMLPRLKSTNFEGMELIRPLYCVTEESIISWMKYNNLEFIRCACRFTENLQNELEQVTSKRKETKEIIRNLKKINPSIENNLLNSIHNVCLDTLPGYKSHGDTHSFLENFEADEAELIL